MASSNQTIKIIFGAVTDAFDKSVSGVKGTIGTLAKSISAFNKEANNGARFFSAMESSLVGVAGAITGLQAINSVTDILKNASAAAFSMKASITAASQEFSNTGSIEQWNQKITDLSKNLRIYSDTELRDAVSKIIDMTKRMGLSADQMDALIQRAGDLGAVNGDLSGSMDKLIAAMHGQQRAANALGITLSNEYVEAWHAAHNATGKVFDDLTEQEKAQVRLKIIMEQTAAVQGDSAASVNTFGGALKYVKTQIDNAITQNPKLTQSLNDLAKTITDNAEGIGNMAAKAVEWAARAMQWLADNKEIVKSIALVTGGIYAMYKAFQVAGTAVNIIKGLGAALEVIQATDLGLWATGTTKALGMAINGVTSLTGKFGLFAAALAVGLEIGTWLNQFDIVQKAGLAMIHGIHMAWLNAKKVMVGLFGGDTSGIERDIKVAQMAYEDGLKEIENRHKKSADSRIQNEKDVQAQIAQTTKDADAVAGKPVAKPKEAGDWNSAAARLRQAVAAGGNSATIDKLQREVSDKFDKYVINKRIEEENKAKAEAEKNAPKDKPAEKPWWETDGLPAGSSTREGEWYKREKTKADAEAVLAGTKKPEEAPEGVATPEVWDEAAREKYRENQKLYGQMMDEARQADAERAAEARQKAAEKAAAQEEKDQEARQRLLARYAEQEQRRVDDYLAGEKKKSEDEAAAIAAAKARKGRLRGNTAPAQVVSASSEDMTADGQKAATASIETAQERFKRMNEAIAAAATQRADAQIEDAQRVGKAENEAADKAKSAWQRYFDRIGELAADEASRRDKMKADLAEMQAGTDKKTGKDKAFSLEKLARQAMAGGDMQGAQRYADQAQAAYKETAPSDKRLAMSGVARVGELGIQIAQKIRESLEQNVGAQLQRATGYRGQRTEDGGQRTGGGGQGTGKTVTLKFAGGSLRGSQVDVDALLRQLENAGMRA